MYRISEYVSMIDKFSGSRTYGKVVNPDCCEDDVKGFLMEVKYVDYPDKLAVYCDGTKLFFPYE